jgi:hypothetical protein
MILLKKRAHLVLKTPLTVVRRLLFDVSDERIHIRWSHRKHPIPSLPSETSASMRLHPYRRARLNLRHNLRSSSGRTQPQRQMHMVGNATGSKTLAPQPARSSCHISMQIGRNRCLDQRQPILRTKNHMHQIKAQRLRHCEIIDGTLSPLTAQIRHDHKSAKGATTYQPRPKA